MFRRIFTNLYLLFFMNGFMLAGLIYLRHEDMYERDLFTAIASKIKADLKTEDKDTFLIKSLQMAYNLQHNRQSIFGEAQSITGTDNNSILHSATEDLMAAKGACGSYSIVLARILKANACEVRIGQMKVNGIFGGHIVVETKIKNRWIIVDPSFNLYFKRPDGQLASFSDVSKNWDYYKQQVPPDYVADYKYEDIRYANWTKIPIIMPAIKKVLDITMGKDAADHFSIRPKIIRMHHFLFIICLWIYIPLCILMGWLLLKRRRILKK